MTAYPTLIQQPETPIVEKLVWVSDKITSDDGSEQRFSLTSLPKANFSGTFVFSTEASIRQHLATMFNKFAKGFDWPIWHNQVVHKRSAANGDLAIYCNTRRSNFRQGGKLLIVEGDKFEIRTVNQVLTDHVTITVALANAYSQRALIMPIRSVYANGQPSLKRTAHNKAGDASFDFIEVLPQDPFIAQADKVALPQFNGLPVLNRRPRGNEYTQSLNTGMEATDYGGMADLRSPWLVPQWSGSLNYQSDRIANVEDWFHWLTFFDYCLGSVNPFYVAQYRNDLEALPESLSSGASRIILKDTEYSDNFYPYEIFRNVLFYTDEGLQHFAEVTSVSVNFRDEDTIDIDPPLPSGNWETAKIAFLLKYRIADDTVTLTHSGVVSDISINVRTVVE